MGGCTHLRDAQWSKGLVEGVWNLATPAGWEACGCMLGCVQRDTGPCSMFVGAGHPHKL